METRKLGRTDLQVSAICFGGNVFGWTADESASFAVLDAFVAGGGNFIDTANVYSAWVPGHRGGESETIIGSWVASRKNRDKVIIATKLGFEMGDGGKGLSRAYIFKEVEASLRRLQTDYIDLYQSHTDDKDVPLEETLGAYTDLIKQGKVRAIGASNYTAPRLAEALRVSEKNNFARYASLQPAYNLVDRAGYEQELEPLAVKENIGVITYYSLASGFLTGKYRPGQPLPETPRAGGIQQKYLNAKGFAILAEVEKVAQAHNATISQVALAWVLSRPGTTIPIASTTTVAQTQELVGASDLKLSAEELQSLDKVSAWQYA
ncbi:MAG TPA: aldo/keto reductase [Ktedonobacteraceae bacterium]|jgi:aryl-alcohol dehydrogenase-like predicted oxidoreductase|nr:aldo/keto reductase [Ktedonobacteraceae bacterium]